jgi:hypothetical protein
MFKKQECCNKYLTFLAISVSLNGIGTVGGFLSTLIPSVRGSKIFGFKALAFTRILKDKHIFWYIFLVCKPLV